MEYCDLETWKSLKLPLNLYNMIMNKFKQAQNKSQSEIKMIEKVEVKESIVVNINSLENQTYTNNNKKEEIKEKKPSNSIFSGVVNNDVIESFNYENKIELRAQIFSLLEKVVKEIKSKEQYEATLKVLYKIIENISRNIGVLQYQKISKTSKSYTQKIQPYISAVNFLSVAGFTEDSENIVLLGKIDYEGLEKLRFYMESFLIEKSIIFIIEIIESNFNPYATYVSGISSDTNPEKNKSIVPGLPEYDKLLKQEKERRAEIYKNSKTCERLPKLFSNNYFNQNEVLKKLEEEDNSSKVLEQDNYAKALAILKESRNDNFKIKARVDLQKLLNEKVHTKALIQFKFSNNIILLAYFALQETLLDIYNFLISQLDMTYIVENDINFEITYGYPPKVMNNFSKTVFEEKLQPNSVIFVNITKGTNVVDPPLTKECLSLLNN